MKPFATCETFNRFLCFLDSFEARRTFLLVLIVKGGH